MAITIDDFSKIWASTSPLTPYEFSESQYKEGWNFIGGTPPSRQMWDFLQKNNDEKMQYLSNNFDNYLPLSGGTMTGSIQYVDNGKVFAIVNTDPGNVDLGWNWVNREGAGIGLKSVDHLKNPGEFSLFARDSANSCSLEGKPDGSLTWDNKDVERVNASGSNYIRYESGLQLCWGELTIPIGTSGREVSGTMTFPYPFANTNYVLTFGNDWLSSSTEYYRAEGRNTANFKFTAVGVGTNQHRAFYIAIGYWK